MLNEIIDWYVDCHQFYNCLLGILLLQRKEADYMFKKIFIFMLALCWFNTGYATEYVGYWYPKYLYDDENYIICDAHMDTGWYIDKSSIALEKEDDNQIILSVTVVGARYKNHHDKQPFAIHDIESKYSADYLYLYDINTKEIYVWQDNDEWKYLDPNGSWANAGIRLYAAAKTYEVQYGARFY